MIRAALLLALLTLPVRDNGQYAQVDPSIRDWFGRLQSQSHILCCSFADGQSVDDPDWTLTGDADFPYSVFLEGKWVKVPKTSVVLDTNRVGHAVVWPVYQRGGETIVRCFLPGAFG